MLIDVHAHFYHDRTPRADWRERNASRLAAGEKIGITIHVASILGSWGRTSPTYFPSPADLPYGNDALLALVRDHPNRIRGYVTVNPNYTAHARGEILRCLAAGMIGIKLAASRRASDPLLDPICDIARDRDVPVLQHVWQHRRRDWPGQEASDAVELCALARRHPDVRFILAHIGGGGIGTTRSRQCAPRPMCTSISRGAVWMPGCSSSVSQLSASGDCSGGPTSRWTPDGPSCATSSACSPRKSSTW